MSKRTRYDECCSYMKHLNLSNNTQSAADIIEREYVEEQTQRTINELQSKMVNIEHSVAARFDYLDRKVNDINSKLDKLVNLMTSISDNQLYSKSQYVS